MDSATVVEWSLLLACLSGTIDSSVDHMASGQWQSTSDADAARRQGPTPREASEAVPPVNEDQHDLSAPEEINSSDLYPVQPVEVFHIPYLLSDLMGWTNVQHDTLHPFIPSSLLSGTWRTGTLTTELANQEYRLLKQRPEGQSDKAGCGRPSVDHDHLRHLSEINIPSSDSSSAQPRRKKDLDREEMNE
ncbi:hypothetical protein T310_7036 [Rasamsonia emersonii CBS 393.64]|uniref:Uncharacterized protein n=1 Tax=Rasamsonia emersonii (strain ATCC 16479 / CBS 393.64 / IMI 116815) TaxID=1408163 RepID=A0A0F4YMY7_RASE3|nr:hypothetical protein T310_7036 [Rasamsonia emersonii CBS 393.64]KKA19008.1 hypothetical protein T310_7036 [Rasamsonia emersonii CBS 393.64]